MTIEGDDVERAQDIVDRRLLGGEVVGEQELEQPFGNLAEEGTGIDSRRGSRDRADCVECGDRVVDEIEDIVGRRIVAKAVQLGGRSVGRQPSRSMNPLNCSTPLKAVCNGRSASARNVPIVCSVPCCSAMAWASRTSPPAPAGREPRQVSG